MASELTEERSVRSLVDAIEDKYKMDESDLDIQIFGLPKNSTSEPDEIIVPRLLCIHDSKITHAGDTAKLEKLCKNVCEVDLDRNLLTDWNEVFRIVSHVPHCSFLNLRANPLSDFVFTEDQDKPEFPNIIKMVLNLTKISWDSLCSVLQVFPNLQELHLSLNTYGTVDIPEDQLFPSIIDLHFRANEISDWDQIAKIGNAFPNLENLVLLNNPLETFPSAEEMAAVFQNLKSINVSETKIKEWPELEKFRYFPSLREIRVQDIPLLQEYTEEVRRQLLLGYLPNVTRLNGGKVIEGEIEDAERAFIRYYMEKSEDQHPPRYAELESKHGKLEPLVEVDLSGKDNVSVMVHYDQQTRRLMEINIHQTVAQLKAKLAKEFNTDLPAHRLKLMLKREGWPAPQRLREEKRTLLNIRLFDGDELILTKNVYTDVRVAIFTSSALKHEN